jgi:hypothetical protein
LLVDHDDGEVGEEIVGQLKLFVRVDLVVQVQGQRYGDRSKNLLVNGRSSPELFPKMLKICVHVIFSLAFLSSEATELLAKNDRLYDSA